MSTKELGILASRREDPSPAVCRRSFSYATFFLFIGGVVVGSSEVEWKENKVKSENVHNLLIQQIVQIFLSFNKKGKKAPPV